MLAQLSFADIINGNFVYFNNREAQDSLCSLTLIFVDHDV